MNIQKPEEIIDDSITYHASGTITIFGLIKDSKFIIQSQNNGICYMVIEKCAQDFSMIDFYDVTTGLYYEFTGVFPDKVHKVQKKPSTSSGIMMDVFLKIASDFGNLENEWVKNNANYITKNENVYIVKGIGVVSFDFFQKGIKVNKYVSRKLMNGIAENVSKNHFLMLQSTIDK